MIKKLLIMILFLLIVTIASADVIKWDASTTDANCVAGYKVYYNENSKVLGNVLVYEINELNLTPNVKYKLNVVAYNYDGIESELSDDVFYIYKGVAPDDNPAIKVEQETPNKVIVTIEYRRVE